MPDYNLPEGHHQITPASVVPGAEKLLSFVAEAFGGQEVARYEMDGSIVHAEVKVGDSVLMVGEPAPGWDPMPAAFSVYVDDVDGAYARAIAAGAEGLEEPKDEIWGHRSARVQDPCGNHWAIAAVIEEISHEEVKRRMAAES